MKQWGREKGADFMLIGEINMIVDQEGGEPGEVLPGGLPTWWISRTTPRSGPGFEKIKKFVGKSKYKS